MSFATDIHPIFVAKCVTCHNIDLGGSYPGHAQPDVDDAYASSIQDGNDGQKVYERILLRTNPPAGAEFDIMPLDCGTGLDNGDCLTTAQYELIEAWVAQDAPP